MSKVKTPVATNSRRRVGERRRLLAKICEIGSMACDDNKPMASRVCLEAVGILTKAGWPFNSTL